MIMQCDMYEIKNYYIPLEEDFLEQNQMKILKVYINSNIVDYCIFIHKITAMKMFHIDDFKCTLCANWFCPPFNLPYLLPCSHSVCTHCLQKSTDGKIICPQDFQSNSINNINVNLSTKKALERLMKEHKSYNENTQLQCIKALSVSFDEIINVKEKSILSLKALIDQIFLGQIDRIKGIHQKIKLQLTRPFKIVDDWKQIVSIYLTSLKKNPQALDSVNLTQFNHYIEEGRKIKLELNEFFTIDFDKFAENIMYSPNVCFTNNFSFSQSAQSLKKKTSRKDQPSSQFRKKQYEDIKSFSGKVDKNSATKLVESKLKITKEQSRSSLPLQTLSLNSLNSLPTNRQMTGNLTKYFSNIHQEQTENFRQYFKEQKPQSRSQSRNSSLKKSRRDEHEMSLSQFQLDYQMPKFYKTLEEPESQKNSISSSYRNSLGRKNDQTKSVEFMGTKPSREQTPNQYKKDCLLLSPEVIRQKYTQQGEQDDNQEMLLSERQWSLGKMNFLKEWQIAKRKPEDEELEIRQKGYYNCQKEKLSYMRRMQILRVQEVLKETLVKDNYIELINQSLHDVDMGLYLSNFNWNDIQIVKFVRTSLSDEQLNTLLNYVVKSRVTALVLSNNNLSQMSLDAFLYFVNVNKTLKNVYLPKNYINILKSKQKINLLKEKGINIYI